MKKFVGFGVMLALMVAPVALVNAQNTVNLFPIAMGTFAGHDTYLAVTNLTDLNFTIDDEDADTIEVGTRITIRSVSQDGTLGGGESDLLAGETRIYASNSSVNPRNFGCADDICTVTVCAPAVPVNGDDVPVISSALFWLNNGQFYAITTPIISVVPGVCPAFGVTPPEPEPEPDPEPIP